MESNTAGKRKKEGRKGGKKGKIILFVALEYKMRAYIQRTEKVTLKNS
jgi:hypothetical protein